MNVAIIGYGKMGKEVEKLLLPYHRISCIIDIHNVDQINNLHAYNTDVAIEFTTPESAVNNILLCFKQNIPVVCGTTGWYDKFDIIKNACSQYNATLFYATNFSIGVNIYFYIIKHAAQILKKHINTYSIQIEEIHHTQKKDSPSGTAITMSKILMNEIPEIKTWVNYINNSIVNTTIHELPIISKRISDVVGTHKLQFLSEIDEIIIEHKAHNRKGFALGAIKAAEFIVGKKGIFTMNDLLEIN
ncbi:MAG: 4-hydroxy-tetrahydrodipicolinate reductase [Bacteroidales bacterium]|nr:4-hydroxy-tetrahydrodipicolinate reductase [Bacteroidales bacterium]